MAQLVELGAAPVNESEREVVRILVEGLPSYYRVFPNICFRDTRRGQNYEYDVVVLTGHAVYVVEIKGWRGTVQAINRGEWQLPNGKFVNNPLPLNDQKAKILASQLKALTLTSRGESLRPPYVQSCLVGGGSNTKFDVFHGDRDVCLRPDEVCAYIDDPSRLPRYTPRDTYQGSMRKIARLIEGTLESRPLKPRRFGSYVVTMTLQQRDEGSTYLAKHAEFDDGRLYRIRTHVVSPYLHAEADRHKRIAVLRRSAEALHRIGDHPNVVSLRAFGDIESGFFEVTDWSDTGSLASALSLGAIAKLDADAQLDILIGIVRGLAAAHEQGIFHRDLRPEAILLGPDGQPRVGSFDLAFIEDAAHTVYGKEASQPIEDHEYRAPELHDLVEYEVYDNTDLYSVGRLAYDLFAGSGSDVRKPLSDLVKLPADWGDALSALVRSMLAEESSERPPDASVVLETLSGLRRPPPSKTEEAASSNDSKTQYGRAEMIDGHNEVLEFLGEGGSSHTYLVRNDLLQDEFALKLAAKRTDPEAPLREFRLLRNLHHPNVITAHWAGKLPTTDEAPGRSYVLLEHLPGATLRERLDQGAVPATEAIQLFTTLVDATAAVHAAGIIHRDIKPENVHLVDRGPVLADFGVGTMSTDPESDLPVGTRRYWAPDVASEGWDQSCDVFSLGCLAYEMLAGRHPWGDKAPHAETPPAPLPDVSELPAAVSEVLARTLRPRRSDRYPDAAALLSALQEAVAASQMAKTNAPVATAATSKGPLLDAGPKAWTRPWVDDLVASDPLTPFLYFSLRDTAFRDAIEGVDLFVAAEKAAFELESPLPETLDAVFDELVEPSSPVLRSAPGEGEPLLLDQDDVLLILDGLSIGDVASIVSWGEEHGREVIEYVWRAGTIDPSKRAECTNALEWAFATVPPVTELGNDAPIGAPGQAVSRRLSVGKRGDDLARLLERRYHEVSDALDRVEASSAKRRLWVTSTFGVVYLGHGLRRDVGELAGAGSDGVRGAWQAACPSGRTGPDPGRDLSGPIHRPCRRKDGRVFPVGRLAWPDAPLNPLLANGGASLLERLLPLVLLTPAAG